MNQEEHDRKMSAHQAAHDRMMADLERGRRYIWGGDESPDDEADGHEADTE